MDVVQLCYVTDLWWREQGKYLGKSKRQFERSEEVQEKERKGGFAVTPGCLVVQIINRSEILLGRADSGED